MKKLIPVSVAFCLVLALASCASTSGGSSSSSTRRVPGAFPDFVKEALFDGPENVLVGVGSAKLASLSQSRTISANRARAEISRILNTTVKDMITDFSASSEVDPESAVSYQENITVSLSQANISGARVVAQDMDEAGNVWTVVYFDAAQVKQIIDQAQAAMNLAPAQRAAFNAQSRMDAAFAKINGEEVQVATE